MPDISTVFAMLIRRFSSCRFPDGEEGACDEKQQNGSGPFAKTLNGGWVALPHDQQNHCQHARQQAGHQNNGVRIQQVHLATVRATMATNERQPDFLPD
jgi:hypothetical protein